MTHDRKSSFGGNKFNVFLISNYNIQICKVWRSTWVINSEKKSVFIYECSSTCFQSFINRGISLADISLQTVQQPIRIREPERVQNKNLELSLVWPALVWIWPILWTVVIVHFSVCNKYIYEFNLNLFRINVCFHRMPHCISPVLVVYIVERYWTASCLPSTQIQSDPGGIDLIQNQALSRHNWCCNTAVITYVSKHTHDQTHKYRPIEYISHALAQNWIFLLSNLDVV